MILRRFTYDELMKVESITSAVSSLALSFGEGGSEKIMSRPFGVALLFAGIDKKGPRYDQKRKFLLQAIFCEIWWSGG